MSKIWNVNVSMQREKTRGRKLVTKRTNKRAFQYCDNNSRNSWWELFWWWRWRCRCRQQKRQLRLKNNIRHSKKWKMAQILIYIDSFLRWKLKKPALFYCKMWVMCDRVCAHVAAHKINIICVMFSPSSSFSVHNKSWSHFYIERLHTHHSLTLTYTRIFLDTVICAYTQDIDRH